VLTVALAAPGVSGVIAKVEARLQGRRGPRIRQPYYDLAKLFRKEALAPEGASWFFLAAPIIAVACYLTIPLLIPVLTSYPLPLGCARMKAMVRCWPVRLAGALAASVLAATGCGGGPGVPSPPSAYLGAVLDKTVPNGVANLPLITDAGKPTSLAALHGQIVVLADFLTLCQETCPLTTGNLLVMDRAVTAAGLGGRVRFVELTVDPDRDTPWRLRAYRRLVEAPPNLLLLTGSPAVIRQIWSYFGVWYQQVAEDDPPGADWLTGKPLTYDVTHQDALIYLDGQGRERFLVVGSPDAAGAPIPLALRRFLSAQGQTDLNHPNASTWTAAEAVSPIAWLTGQPIHLPAS
jgi:protein SCO1